MPLDEGFTADRLVKFLATDPDRDHGGAGKHLLWSALIAAGVPGSMGDALETVVALENAGFLETTPHITIRLTSLGRALAISAAQTGDDGRSV